jgi:Tol biopolymer transport system component
VTVRLLSSKRRKVIAAAAAVIAIASTALVLGVADSASPPEAGLAVDTHVDHSYIYTVDVATEELTQETNHQGEGAQEPSFSAQGEIAFSTMDCDECSSTIAQLDPGPGPTTEVPIDTPVEHLFQPSWAPDGNRVATVALGRGIYSVNSQTGAAKRLTTDASDEAPDWAPAGDLVAFHRQLSGTNYEIYTVNAATGQERRRTQDKKQQTNPTWSPDGTHLAFAEQRDNGLWAIVTMKTNGTERKRITAPDISAQEPAWSPDGKSIAVILQELDKAAVAVIPANGGSPRRLTNDRLFPSKPSWSPDGKSIAFAAIVVPEPTPTN